MKMRIKGRAVVKTGEYCIGRVEWMEMGVRGDRSIPTREKGNLYKLLVRCMM